MSTWWDSLTPEEYPRPAPAEVDPDDLRPVPTFQHVPVTREQLLDAINSPATIYCGKQVSE